MNIEQNKNQCNILNGFVGVVKQIVTTFIYTTDDKIVKIVPDMLYRFGIALTAWAPTSSRSLAGYLIRKPFRLVQSLYNASFKQGENTFSQKFYESMKEYHNQDWIGGIHDSREYATPEEAKNYRRYLDAPNYEDENLCSELEKIGFKKVRINKLPFLSDSYQNTIDNLEAFGFQKIGLTFDKKQPKNFKGFLNLRNELTNYVVKLRKIYNEMDKNYELTKQTKKFKKYEQKLEEYGFKKSDQETEVQFKDLDKISGNFLDEPFYYSEKTGTVFSLHRDDNFNEVMIDFIALGGGLLVDKPILVLKTIFNTLVNFFGGVDAASLEAIKVGEVVKKHFSHQEDAPTVVPMGHSHGGGLAQCAAIANDLNGVVFNSRPNGSGIRRYLGSEKIAKNKITSFISDTDFLNDRPYICKLGLLIERVIGILMPRNMANKSLYLKGKKNTINNSHEEYSKHLREVAQLDN